MSNRSNRRPRKKVELSRLPRKSHADWAKNVLPQEISSAWNSPDALHGVIALALEARLASKVVKAAQRLRALEPTSERSAVALAAVLLHSGNKKASRGILEIGIKQHPKSAPLLINLSKLEAREGRPKLALELALSAVRIQPNDEHAVRWFDSIVKQVKVPEERVAILESAAGAGWLSKVILAEHFLRYGRPSEGKDTLVQALEAAEDRAAAAEQIATSLQGSGALGLLATILEGRVATDSLSPATKIAWARSLSQNADTKAAESILDTVDLPSLPGARTFVSSVRAQLAEIEGPLNAEIFGVHLRTPIWSEQEDGASETDGRCFILPFACARDDLQLPLRGLSLRVGEHLCEATKLRVHPVIPVLPGRGLIRLRTPMEFPDVLAVLPRSTGDAVLVRPTVSTSEGAFQVALFLTDVSQGRTWAKRIEVRSKEAIAVESTRALVEEFVPRARSDSSNAVAIQRELDYSLALENLLVLKLVFRRVLPRSAMWNEEHGIQGCVRLINAQPDHRASWAILCEQLRLGRLVDPDLFSPVCEALRPMIAKSLFAKELLLRLDDP